MARSITVRRKIDGASLFDEPLGSESAVRESWSGAAAGLGLPLLAGLFEQGFAQGSQWAGPELPQLLAELTRLEAHWQSAELPADDRADLVAGAGNLRAAVALAEASGGFVEVE